MNDIKYLNDEETKESFGVKTVNFLRNNAITILIILSCVIYVFKGFIEVSSTSKTLTEIIFDSLITYIMGISLSTLLGEKGIQDGLRSEKYSNSIREYSKVIDLITPNIDRLDNYCDYKNEQRLKRRQTLYLRKHGLTYDKWNNCEYSVDKLTDNQKNALDEIGKIDVFRLTFEYLTSDSIDLDESDKKIPTINSYKGKTAFKNALVKIIIALTFGFFAIDFILEQSLANVIYSVIQICVWLMAGAMTYLNSYSFITETYRQNVIIKKTNYLYDFNELNKKYPQLFENIINVKEEIYEPKSNTDS